MRRLYRGDLPLRSSDFLRKKQASVDAGSPARETWDQARKTKPMQTIADVLRRMTGKRARCMYCEDSRGTEIDHYRPIARFKEAAFVWSNLLWCCGDCNRHKAARFALDARGNPLLVDPTAEEPWEFLYYDTTTGNITARYDAALDSEEPRGKATLDIISALSDEAVVEGRLRTYRNLRRAVLAFLGSSDPRSSRARLDLLESLQDNDGYGLVAWYFRYDGREEAPFEELARRFPDVWREVL